MIKYYKELPLRPLPSEAINTPDTLVRMAKDAGTVVFPVSDGLGKFSVFNLADHFTGKTTPEKILHVYESDEIDVTHFSKHSAVDKLIIVSEVDRPIGWTTANECLLQMATAFLSRLEECLVKESHIILKETDTIYAAHKALFNKQRQAVIITGSDGEISGIVTDADISRYIEAGCDIWSMQLKEKASPVRSFSISDLRRQDVSSSCSPGEMTIVVTDERGKPQGIIPAMQLHRRGGVPDPAGLQADTQTPSEPIILDTVLNTSLRTGIVGTDEFLNIIYFNESLADFVNAPDRIRLGGEIWDVTDSCGISRESFASYLENARNDREQVILNWIKINNVRRYIRCRLSKIDSQEHLAGFVLSIQDITAQRNAEDAIRKLAYQDRLTQLPNRLLFDERLDQEIKRARRNQTKFAVMMLDLDGFKQVNDKHGHSAGDKLLYTVGRRLQTTVRETDTVARFGGDEFIFILPDIQHEADVINLADKIRRVTKRHCNVNDEDIEISASIGFAIYPDESTDRKELLDQADARMYREKRKEY